MKHVTKENDWFLRIDPDESLMDCIISLAKEHSIKSAVILSGVGMLSFVRLGFYDIDQQRYIETEFNGIYDLNVVCGNLTWLDQEPWPHVHAVFNDASHKTISGHVLEARCHITTELFLSTNSLELHRQKLGSCPIPRLTTRLR